MGAGVRWRERRRQLPLLCDVTNGQLLLTRLVIGHDETREVGVYDVVVVGARCAGAFTAMLLARRGHRVLAVDRAAPTSDVLCAQHLGPVGVAVLQAHGLLPALKTTACPMADRMVVFAGPTTLEVNGRTCSLRRRVLDSLLAEAAADAGAEVRHDFRVTEVVWDEARAVGVVGHGPDERSVLESARFVIGADGRRSFVADAVRAERYLGRPATTCCYYAYWSGVNVQEPQLYLAERRAVGVFPTHDSVACVVATRPVSDWAHFKRAPEAMYLDHLESFPALRLRFARARRQSRFFGTAELDGCFRRPLGPGWALVGDAGHHRDPLLGGGMADAFLQGALVAAALDEGLRSSTGLDRAMAAFKTLRDGAWEPLYRATTAIASFAWSFSDVPRLLQQFFDATEGTARVVGARTSRHVDEGWS